MSNINQIRTKCAAEPTANAITDDCNPCILHLKCQCSAEAANFNLTAEISTCYDQKISSASVLYAVNLALTKSFYEFTNLSIGGGELLTPDKMFTLAPVDWPTFGENISRILAEDSSYSMSLSKIAQTLRNNSPYYTY